MRTIPYEEARLLMQPGDALLTAEPGLAAAGIRWWTGDAWSHIAAPVCGWPDKFGTPRAYVAQANAGLGIHAVRSRGWIRARAGRVCWIPTDLNPRERQAFNCEAGAWFGCHYEGARDFLLQGLGLPAETSGEDEDKICSAFWAVLWAASGRPAIPGRPWFRWQRPRPGFPYVPTPGAIFDHLTASLGFPAWEVTRPIREDL